MSNIIRFFMFLLACTAFLLNSTLVVGKDQACTSKNPEDHRYIILLKKKQSSAQFESYLSERIQTYNEGDGLCFRNSFETLADMKDTHIYLARIADQIVTELKKRPDVESVEKDGVVTATNPTATSDA